jgi:AcrR family transcriptional regulator
MAVRKTRRTRAEKAAENRRRLVQAAVEVIGQHGYAEASVARIVERAGLAQGTFYLYFESRQDLFDRLLPEVGGEALAYIRDRVSNAPGFLAMEERGLQAFFDYVLDHPWYFRLFTEAEVAAPRAFASYTADRTGRFLEALSAAWRRGEVKGYSQRELGVLTQVMLAARTYLYQEYGKSPAGPKRLPPWVVAAYMKFISRGIGALDSASGTANAQYRSAGQARSKSQT